MIINYPKDYIERVQEVGVDFSLLTLLLGGKAEFPGELEKHIKEKLFSLMSKIKTNGSPAAMLLEGLKDTTAAVKVFFLREKVLEVNGKVSCLADKKAQLSEELIADLRDIINSGMIDYPTVVCLQQFIMIKSGDLNHQNQATGWSGRTSLEGHLLYIYESLSEKETLIPLFEIGKALNQIKSMLGGVLMAEDVSTIERLHSLVMLAAEGKSYVVSPTVNKKSGVPSRKKG